MSHGTGRKCDGRMTDALTHRQVAELLDLIQRIEFDELTLEFGGFSIHLVRRPGAASRSVAMSVTNDYAGAREIATNAEIEPLPAIPTPEKAMVAGTVDDTGDVRSNWLAVRAPMMGTFYAAPAPGAEPFVSVGDKVSESSTVCVVEVMKLYTEIKAEWAGTIVQIDAVDGQLVEHDQVLMWIEPA